MPNNLLLQPPSANGRRVPLNLFHFCFFIDWPLVVLRPAAASSRRTSRLYDSSTRSRAANSVRPSVLFARANIIDPVRQQTGSSAVSVHKFVVQVRHSSIKQLISCCFLNTLLCTSTIRFSSPIASAVHFCCGYRHNCSPLHHSPTAHPDSFVFSDFI